MIFRRWPYIYLYYLIIASCKVWKFRLNYLAALEESSLWCGKQREIHIYIYICPIYICIYIPSSCSQAAWWRPICVAGNSALLSRYLPPSTDCFLYTCARGGRCTCSKRGQNLSAMHDLSVAYRPRRAARHYAWKAKRRALRGRPIAVLVLMNLNRPDQWKGPRIPLPLVCPM